MRFHRQLHGSLGYRGDEKISVLSDVSVSGIIRRLFCITLQLSTSLCLGILCFSNGICHGPEVFHPHLHETFCSCEVVLIGHIEDTVCQFRVHNEVHEQLLEPAQCPGGFKYGGDRDTDNPVPPRKVLSGHPASRYSSSRSGSGGA